MGDFEGLTVKWNQKIMKIYSINKIKLWLDDERDPSDPKIKELFGSSGDEVWVKKVEEAIVFLEKREVSSISFDNDLGDGNKEGRHLASWIEEQAYFNAIPPMNWRIHSKNLQNYRF